MMNFREYSEAADVVEKLGNAILFSEDDAEEFGDRILGGAAEFGKGLTKGIVGLPLQTLYGAGRGLKRAFWGGESVREADARREFHQAKVDLLKSLMYMSPNARDQEINRFKTVLDAISAIRNKDPMAKDPWYLRALQRGDYQGYQFPDYEKLAK